MSSSTEMGGETGQSAEMRLLDAEAGEAVSHGAVGTAAAQPAAAAGWTSGQIALAAGIGVAVFGGIAAAIAAGLSGGEPPHPRPEHNNCRTAELPGVNGSIGYGIDMKMGADGGGRAMFGPVLDTQCTEGWGNQLSTSSPLLYVPDSMFWFPDPAVETPGWIFHTTRGVRNMMRVLFGYKLQSFSWPDSVLLNAPAVTLAADVLQTGNAYVRTDYRLSVFTAGYRNYEKARYVAGLLSPAFLEEANAINGDQDAAALVRKYGTHVLVQATFGGIRMAHGAVKSTYQSSDASAAMNGRVAADHAVAAAGTTLGGSQVSAAGTSAQWDTLSPISEPMHTCVGGNVSSCQTADWAASVTTAPAPISGIVVPLYDLGFDTNQRTRLRDYIQAYLGDPGDVPKQPSVGRPEQVLLASCDCQVVPSSCQCPTDTYIVGVQNDTAGIRAGAMTCCRLCDSASPTIGPTWFGPQHTGALPDPAIHVPVNVTGPDAAVCGSLARLPGADRLGLAYDFFKGQLKTSTVWDSTRRYDEWTAFDSTSVGATAVDANPRSLCVPSEATAVAGDGQPDGVHASLVYAPRDYATAKLMERIDPNSNITLQVPRVLGAAGSIPPRVMSWFGAARHVVTHLHMRRPLWKVSLADTSGFTLSKPFTELAYATRAPEMVEYYGTHFVSGVEMGALLEADILTDDDYYSQQGPAKVLQQAEALFAELAGTGTPRSPVDPVFRNASVVSITMNGGASQWFPVSAFATMPNKWAEALKLAPVVTRLELQPIWSAADRVNGASDTLEAGIREMQQQYIQTNYSTVPGMVAQWGKVWTGPATPVDENRDWCYADYRSAAMVGTADSAMADGYLHAKTPRICTHTDLHTFTPIGSRATAAVVDAEATACATNFSGPAVPLAPAGEALFGVSFRTPATGGCDFPEVGRSATITTWDDSFAGTPGHCLPGSGNNNCCAHGATAMGNRYVSNSTGDWAMTGRLLCHTQGYYMNCQY